MSNRSLFAMRFNRLRTYIHISETPKIKYKLDICIDEIHKNQHELSYYTWNTIVESFELSSPFMRKFLMSIIDILILFRLSLFDLLLLLLISGDIIFIKKKKISGDIMNEGSDKTLWWISFTNYLTLNLFNKSSEFLWGLNLKDVKKKFILNLIMDRDWSLIHFQLMFSAYSLRLLMLLYCSVDTFFLLG